MVTKLKNISHLFLTRRQKIREARAVQPEKESPPMYTVLIAGLVGNGASSGFSSSLAKALCKKVSSVFLFNAGHDVIKSALIMR
ncbi:MAG: hypothetical protein GY868_09030, partial [Deltaproteobacteria bacterium]|nr:hypothetical protein [Deltaproteobacteria bacterium]